MKLWHRVFSVLLAMVLLFGLFPTVRPTVVEAAAPTNIHNHLPSTAKDIKYLSDMTWETSVNYQDKVAIKDGRWSDGVAIVLGRNKSTDTAFNNTTFTKGLGVMAKNTSSAGDSYTIFDLADNSYAQSYFYAAAGLTNASALAANKNYGVVFEVWGSYDKSVEDYTQAEYVLLEKSGDPTKNTHVNQDYVYQFHLDVTGVRYLKLVVYAVGAINGMNSAWGGACLYNNPGYYPKGDLMGLNNNSDNSTWVPKGTSQHHTYHINDIPSDAVLLSGTDYKGTNGALTSKASIYSASGNFASGNRWFGGVTETFVASTASSGFVQKEGILVRTNEYLRYNAKNATTAGYATFDVSGLNANRFYAMFGSGNLAFAHKKYDADRNEFAGIIAEVWGCETKDGTYVKLAESEPIRLCNVGEFFVDITGYNFLRLYTKTKSGSAITGADCMYYMPCVFKEWDINATGATSVVQGTAADYTATFRHDFEANYNYTGAVTWTVEGAQKAGTKFTGAKLAIDPAETATSLTVKASITEGGKTFTSAPITVAVTKAPVYALDITGPAESGRNTEHTLVANVTKDGVAEAYDKITWSISGGTDSATKIDATGKLTIGNEPLGTELTVKAKLTEYGITREDTLKITIATYALKVDGNTEMLPGSQTALQATITNDGQVVNSNVTWKVEGDGKIDVSGNVATVTADAKVGKIKVTATWTTPASKVLTATHEINVNAYSVAINGAATAVGKGDSLPLTVAVKKNGETLDNPSVAWQIMNLKNGTLVSKPGASVVLDITEDAGTVLLVTASYKIGGLTVSDTYTVNVTDYKLAIDAPAQVVTGKTAQLKATLTKGGTAVSNPAITWKLTKPGSSAVNVTGDTLNLAANDAVGTVYTVVVTAIVDGETMVSAPATVTVVAPDVYTMSLDKATASVKPGGEVNFTATVTKNGTALTAPAVTWTVTGGQKAGTKIENGKLTIDSTEAAGTVLTVTATYAAAELSKTATVTVVEVPKQDNAYTAVTDKTYQTVPGNATYLADAEVVWVESKNLNGAQAIRNGAWQNGAAIYIGGTATTGGTKFDKGIGVQPQSPTATNNRGASWTTIDISTYDVDTFYAAIGGTNASNQQNGHNSFIYQVLGGTDKNGAFTLLAESEPITKTQTGEFKVDISGYKYLKLLIKCTETGTHGYGNSVWANACVYNSKVENYIVAAAAAATNVQQGRDTALTVAVTKDGHAVTDQTVTWTVTGGTKAGTKIENGKLFVDKAEAVGTKLSVTASITVNGVTYNSGTITITVTEYLSELYQPDAFTSTSKFQKLAKNVIWLSDVKWVESVNLGNKEAIRNGAWQNGAAIYIGGKSGGDTTDGTKFDKGIGVQPQAPTATNNRGASWTTINVANLKCDTFYAAIGGTNQLNQNEGQNSFIYQVLGNTEKDGEFTLLAESKPITKTETGEFKLNIKGIYELKLVIKCTDTGSHSCGNSVWANACVFNKDGSNGNLSAMGVTATTNETPKQKKAYTSVKNSEYLTPTGKITFVSDMDWVESVNLENKEAIRNGVWQNGAAIWLGGNSAENGGTKFVKGIGVQPQAPTADNNRGASWTTVDITGLGVDTFYAAVGGTNAANRENGHNSFIYQVYGGAKAKGKFTLLAQSEPITKTMTGEFKVDISGYNFLKLVIKCTDTGSHGYGNSMWANACVFNSAEGSLVEGEVEVTQPTIPTVVKPRPTVPVDKAEGEGKDISAVIIIGLVVVILIAAAVAVALILKKKKNKK